MAGYLQVNVPYDKQHLMAELQRRLEFICPEAKIAVYATKKLKLVPRGVGSWAAIERVVAEVLREQDRSNLDFGEDFRSVKEWMA